MQIVLLHSAQVETSRDIVAELGGEPAANVVTITHDGLEVRVVSKHALAVGVCPNFSAYPAIVVIEDDGKMRCKSPVENWSECREFIDTPVAVQAPVKKVEYAKLEFLKLFSDEEKISLKALEATDPTVALFWEEYRSAETIRLDDPRTMRAVEYLSAQGYLAQGRKAEILGE